MTTPDPLQCTYEDARRVHLRDGIALSTGAKVVSSRRWSPSPPDSVPATAWRADGSAPRGRPLQRKGPQDEPVADTMVYEHNKHDGSLPLMGVNTFLGKDGHSDVATEIKLIRSTQRKRPSRSPTSRTSSRSATRASA